MITEDKDFGELAVLHHLPHGTIVRMDDHTGEQRPGHEQPPVGLRGVQAEREEEQGRRREREREAERCPSAAGGARRLLDRVMAPLRT